METERDKNGNTLGRREINKTASRTRMNRKVMFGVMKIFSVFSPPLGDADYLLLEIFKMKNHKSQF